MLDKIAAYRKALVAVLGATLAVLAVHGVAVPEWVSEEKLASLFAALTPVLVWLFPNGPVPGSDGS